MTLDKIERDKARQERAEQRRDNAKTAIGRIAASTAVWWHEQMVIDRANEAGVTNPRTPDEVAHAERTGAYSIADNLGSRYDAEDNHTRYR